MSENKKRKLKKILSKKNERNFFLEKTLRNENEKRRRDLFNELIMNLGEILFDHLGIEQKKCSKNIILKETLSFIKENKDFLVKDQKKKNSSINSQSLSYQMNILFDSSFNLSNPLINIEQFFHLTIESMNSIYMILNLDGIIEYVSLNVFSYLNYSSEELIGKSIGKIIHPIDLSSFQNYFSNSHQVLKSVNVRLKENSCNDNYHHSTFIGTFRKMKDDEMKYISMIEVNTLDRRLVFVDHRYSQFIIHLNPNGKIIFCNEKVEECIGYCSNELIGRSLFDLVHPDDIRVLVKAHQSWRDELNVDLVRYRILTKGEEWISIETRCQTNVNSWTGKPLFFICINDISLSNSIEPNNEEYLFVEDPIEGKDNEITTFLNDVDNEKNREKMFERLIELKRVKEEEIRSKQEEIEVINDLMLFINEHHSKQFQSNEDSPFDDLLSNIMKDETS